MAHRNPHQGEIELKFELDGRAARKVRHHPLLAKADRLTQSHNTVYFDTGKGKVHKAGYSLRVRQVDDRFTQTVKSNGGSAGLFDRGEWEAEVAQMAPDRKALKQTPLASLRKLDRKVAATVCSDVERTTWLVDRDGALIEIVLDSGTVTCGDEEASFRELELELKGGRPSALFDVAQEMNGAIPLHIGVLGKEERGLLLGKGAFEHEHKASRLDISHTMDVAQVFALVVHECIRQFRLNEALIVAERNPRALHQARVAMRRLRTGFSLFGPAIRQGSIEPLRRELREFIDPFGEARNLDVFLGNHGDELGWRDRRKLTSARSDAYDRVVEALGSQHSRDMLLDIVEWTASDDWRKGAATSPIGKFAAGRLEAGWRKVKRKGARLGDLEERQLHRLRITIKKLRYGIEFLAPLYARKPVHRFRSSLEKMQDCLGLIHDDMVSRQIVADFALAETDRTDVTARSHQLKAAAMRFKQLRRVGSFWAS